MQIPKSSKSPNQESGFGLGSLIGSIFLLIGVLLALSLTDFIPIDLSGFSTILQYGAALGSILGGISMIFKKKQLFTNVKLK